MLVAITGGTGFVGSHTVRAVREAGHGVRLLVRDPAKMRRIHESRGLVIDDFVEGDVTDPDAVSSFLRGCDAVIHTAAVVALDAVRASEVQATNARGVELVVGGAVKHGLEHIVYVSSSAALLTPGGAPITGDSPVGYTTTAYGVSKAAAERYVRGLQDDGAPIQTVYPTAVVGPDDPGLTDPNRALCIMLKIAALLTSSGYQPVDVRDLARLHLAMLEGPSRPGRHVAAGRYLPWAELYDRIEALTGLRLRRVRCPGFAARGAGRIADVVKRALPFDLPLSLESMMFATQWPTADGGTAERDFGVRFRDIDLTLTDTCRWLYRAGHLERRHIGRLAD